MHNQARQQPTSHPSLNRSLSSNVRPPLPTPVTSSSVSPPRQHSRQTAYPFPRRNTKTSSNSEELGEESEVDEDGSGSEDKKLEQRREKNRIKQRNLRLRRQKHLDDLEEENEALKGEVSNLRKNVNDLQQRENNLHAWIRDLESVLFARGLSGEVNSLRRIWSATQQRTSADPLATLASAAMASRPPPVQQQHQQQQPVRHQPVAAASRRASHDSARMSYPSQTTSWDSHSYASWIDQGNKRKRDEEFYPPAPPPPHHVQPAYSHHHSNAAPLGPPSFAPSAPYSSGLPSSSRPTTAPRPTSPRPSNTPRGSHSGSIRISDLLSPLPSEHTIDAVEGQIPDHASIGDAMSRRESEAIVDRNIGGLSGSETGGRRWSAGELSVIEHSLSSAMTTHLGQNVTTLNQFPPPHSFSSTSSQSNISFSNVFSQNSSSFTSGNGQGSQTVSKIACPPAIDPTSTTTSSDQFGLIDPDLSTHPSILAARSFLLSILPSPLSLPLPPLPPLEPAFQRLVLLALTNLVPLHLQHVFHQRQLKYIPAEDAKTLLQYQADPNADARLILFPIAILRAKTVKHVMDGNLFDVTQFINATLSSARIFGSTLDPDAWEMDDDYWEVWEHWFPRGKSYCHSLIEWRRRDGHRGSTVVEMLLGVEAPGARRVDPVGKPPNWSF